MTHEPNLAGLAASVPHQHVKAPREGAPPLHDQAAGAGDHARPRSSWDAEARLEADVRVRMAELQGVIRALLDTAPSVGADVVLREKAARLFVLLGAPTGAPWA